MWRGQDHPNPPPHLKPFHSILPTARPHFFLLLLLYTTDAPVTSSSPYDIISDGENKWSFSRVFCSLCRGVMGRAPSFTSGLSTWRDHRPKERNLLVFFFFCFALLTIFGHYYLCWLNNLHKKINVYLCIFSVKRVSQKPCYSEMGHHTITPFFPLYSPLLTREGCYVPSLPLVAFPTLVASIPTTDNAFKWLFSKIINTVHGGRDPRPLKFDDTFTDP